VRVEKLRRIGRPAHATLLLAVLIGSAAYGVGAGWRDLIGLVPGCQDGYALVVTCVTGDQPPGLSWYGTAFAVVLWLAFLRWSTTSVAPWVAARTVVTLGTGLYAADLLRGNPPPPNFLTCPEGECLSYFWALTLTQAALGLLIGAAIAFALMPPRIRVAPDRRRLAPFGATAPPSECP
jgi:hypothetical protein